jgi:enamine deaminase RidA (YjgF/YER057c/UK114 family)
MAGPIRFPPSEPRHAPAIRSGVRAALTLALLVAAPPTFVEGQAAYDPEARLAEMGIELPVPAEMRTQSFDRVAQTGNLVFTSGHGACGDWEGTGRGKVPSVVSVEEAQATARQVGICLLGSLKAHLGDLSRVRRIVKVLGMVNSEPDFTGQSQVMNGFSFFMQEVFGEAGHHARSAVGMAALPVDFTVEIEMVVEVDND